MLKNVLSIVSSPGRRIASHNCDSISAQTLVRYLSTSSAIDKGLRKSRHGRSRFDPPARVGGITRRGEYAKGVEDRRQGKPSLDPRSIRRAGYGKQVDDSRPGTRTSTPWLRSRDDQEPATTPRQGRLPSRQGYLSSRQRPSFAATESKPLRSRPKPSTYDIGHSQKDSPRSLSPRWAQNQSGKPMARATPLNRAQRRAAAFGHMQNPPEGYKALPTISEEQQDRSSKRLNDDRTVSSRHSSSSWRVARGKGSPTTSSRVERRWADTPGRTDFRDASADRSALSSEDRPRRKSTAPLAIPYTTPASEFLYGHSVVTAALKSSRRRFYKLYLYNGDAAEVRGQDREVRKLALAANVEVTRVGNDWLKLMDKMSGGRPHNVS